MDVKGVILAAGYGSRFLPITKTIPKEMLPLIDIPAIHLIIEEFIDSGIKDILIITSRRKKVLEDYFDREIELEEYLPEEKKRKIPQFNANIFFTRQKRMGGTGDALLLCEPFVGKSPFIVAYPDDILFDTPPFSKQMIEEYKKSISKENPAGCTVLCGEYIDGDVSRYGVMDLEIKEDLIYVREMVEKPEKGKAPSNCISVGRYLYTYEIFEALKDVKKTIKKDGEFYQTEPINILAKRGKVVCKIFTGTRLDTGTPEGYIKSLVDFIFFRRKEYKSTLLNYLEKRLKEEN